VQFDHKLSNLGNILLVNIPWKNESHEGGNTLSVVVTSSMYYTGSPIAAN
jgi:hypothetical protein